MHVPVRYTDHSDGTSSTARFWPTLFELGLQIQL